MKEQVNHDPEAGEFYKTEDGKKAYVQYEKTDADIYDFTHTFVPPELRGRGLAKQVVEKALNWAQERNLKIRASCPFVKKYIDRHGEFQSLMAE